MLHTAKEIVRVYGRALLKTNKQADISAENLPSLRANNIQLSKITKLSSRTIQRHIDRLQQAKIITRKVWHGSRSNYELWINPKILWINGLITPKSSKMEENPIKTQTTNNQYIKKDNLTKCPHRDTRNSTGKKNNILIAVDKFKNNSITALAKALSSDRQPKRCSLGRTGFLDVTSYTQLKDPVTQLKEAGGIRGKASSDGLTFSKPEGIKNILSDWQTVPSRHTFLLEYAEKLWKLAREKLYNDTYLTQSQYNSAISLLYKWYSPVANQKLEKVHKIYCQRIEMVQKYIARDPEKRYVQLPSLYFDPDNPHGFTGTKPWYKKQKEYRKTLSLELILRNQIQKFKRNEQKDTAEGRPRITVYKECWQNISKLADPILLNRFEKAAQNIVQL
ncbi:hypothetical protein HN014_10560 [Aquimarina sp. TRL1]|uniref:hypothetical protein n=1 Tax=Aquimarina sp. (strain TRL1) TaxID=2736252 RepID=UPI00158DF809|nr:hypothetical protein [Aquimarina sp. TRL1]QKX05338.1 hypothetical protein HN014_10560 [Aquimarina sp. TRL1]